MSKTPLLLNVMRHCWRRYLSRIQCRVAYSPDLPLWILPQLAVIGSTVNRRQWAAADINTLGQLFDAERCFTFVELQSLYDLPTGQFITHAAILNVIKMIWPFENPRPDATLVTLLTWSPKKHRITNIYRAINPRLPLHSKIRSEEVV